MPVTSLPEAQLPFCSQLAICLFFFSFLRAAPTACGGSQASGQIGATVAGPHHSHSHSHSGSEPRSWPTPQLRATLAPQPTKGGQGSDPPPHGSSSDSFLLRTQLELQGNFFKKNFDLRVFHVQAGIIIS